ncbi:MAG: hypothetical protein KDA22_05330 [Phycisphaerales bacterium]|nr:hypothetical protein [Phycisphaerales bacterium]
MSQDQVIRIMCPNLGCQRILAVPSNARGKLVRCKGCGTNIRIPNQRQPAEDVPAPEQKSEEAA